MLSHPKKDRLDRLSRSRRERTYELAEDQFMPLGDNSPASSDARYWEESFVERRLLVGKCFYLLAPFVEYAAAAAEFPSDEADTLTNPSYSDKDDSVTLILEAKGLVKTYGRRRVVDGVDFEVEPGEIVGLLGPNGAGKTTSFRMTCGMIEPDAAGRAAQQHRCHPLADVSPRGRGHGLSGPGIERLSQALGREEPAGRDGNARHGSQAAQSALRRICWSNSALRGCARARRSRSPAVSGGDWRSPARLVSNPKIILLDEPFTGIDPVTIDSIQKIIRDLRDRGISILITDHQVARRWKSPIAATSR